MVQIDSRKKWNDTQIKVVAGKRYRFEATGIWKDWLQECDADGFTSILMSLSNWTKRVRGAPWFRLIGAVDKDLDHPIVLGVTGEFVAPASGTLWAFANDAGFAYGNNKGWVDLVVELSGDQRDARITRKQRKLTTRMSEPTATPIPALT